MAFREVTVLQVKEVLRLWLAGAQKKRIATQLGFGVKTVGRYVAGAMARGLAPGATLDDAIVAGVVAATRSMAGRPQGDDWSACAAQRYFIARHLAQRVRLSKIAKLLRRSGVVVTYQTVRRFAIAELL